MLEFAVHLARPSLSMLVNHDDNTRDVAYTSGAEKLLKVASKKGWTIISVKEDWKQVFEEM
ncbi:MAG: hypothetical protein EYC68_18135 [Chloroflexota bacterium]|nr:MAG: hypothetical protein EYC68_18135 [Chloroflexota bacterium]